MFKEIIEIRYEVPQAKKLAAEFAKSAKVSNGGEKIEVGHYTAKKSGAFMAWLLEVEKPWVIQAKETTPSLKNDMLVFLSNNMSQEKIIELMAQMEAEDNVSEEDKKAAFKQALHDKIISLDVK